MVSGATTIAIRSFAFRMNVPTVSFQSNGGAIRSLARLRPHQRGTSRPSTTINCVMPSVATVSTSRGECRNRRMIPISTTTPSTTASTSPAPRPSRYGHPQNRMNAAANAVGTAPRSAWAKLITRFAR